jgi:FeS assembly SUF system protein
MTMYQKADDDLSDLDVPYMEGSADHPLESAVMDALRSVYDPEIPVSIVELGLIYNVEISGKEPATATITMTLTAPGCPVAELMPGWIKAAVEDVAGMGETTVEIVWDPFWRPGFMTEAAKIEAGIFF